MNSELILSFIWLNLTTSSWSSQFAFKLGAFPETHPFLLLPTKTQNIQKENKMEQNNKTKILTNITYHLPIEDGLYLFLNNSIFLNFQAT
jgi:hypothetical protein